MKKTPFAQKTAKLLIISIIIIGSSFMNKAPQATAPTVISLELITNVNPIREQYALNMQQTLREIGIDLKVEILEWGTFVGSILPSHYELGIIGFSFGTDPDLSTFFHSTGGLNIFGPWNDSRTNDFLLEAGLATAVPAERKIIYDEWQEHLMDVLPCIPLANPTTYTARAATIENYHPAYGSFYPTITRDDAGTIFVYASSTDPVNLNPVQSADTSSSDAFDACLDGLYTYDYDFNIVPQLAAGDPIVSEDGLTWTVPLRDDIYWHDGEQFDAYDVFFSVMAYCNPENPILYGLGGDTGSINADNWEAIFDEGNSIFTGNVTILDLFTIQFEMPKVHAPYVTDALMSSIIPEHVLNISDTNLDGKISDEAAWQNYSKGIQHIGTGSYYFTADDWVKGTQYMNRIRTDPTNPYWPGSPATDVNNVPFDLTWTTEDVYQIEQVIVRTLPQMATQIAEFEAGGIDFVGLGAFPELIPVYEADPRFNVTSAPSYYYDILVFNLEDPVFKSDPAKGKMLRKAIAYAIDRESLVETIRGGYAVVCDNPLSPANTFYYNWDNPVIYRYDIETALLYFDHPNIPPTPTISCSAPGPTISCDVPGNESVTVTENVTDIVTNTETVEALGLALISTLVILNLVVLTLKKRRKV